MCLLISFLSAFSSVIGLTLSSMANLICHIFLSFGNYWTYYWTVTPFLWCLQMAPPIFFLRNKVFWSNNMLFLFGFVSKNKFVYVQNEVVFHFYTVTNNIYKSALLAVSFEYSKTIKVQLKTKHWIPYTKKFQPFESMAHSRAPIDKRPLSNFYTKRCARS